jgi:single-strand DNA-binding protein
MASFNKVILMGNLTRDPQVKYTPKGIAVAEIGMAVNRRWFDKATNRRKEETTFVDVTIWGRTAEVAGQYLKKGASILIEGRLQLDSWDDKESGQKRNKLRVVCEEMQMLGGRQDVSYGEESQVPAHDGPPPEGIPQGVTQAADGFANDDEVPF